MCAGRVIFVGAALAVALALSPPVAAGPAGGDPPSIAVVDISPPGRPATAAIERLRRDLAALGLAVLEDGPLRDALELPATPDGAADAAPVSRARELLAEARTAQRDLEHHAALDRLEAIDRALAAAAPTAEVLEILAARQRLAGAILLADGNRAGAAVAFRAADALEPQDALDPATYPPKVAAAYAAAVRERAPAGRLVLAGLPRGATVHLDGREGSADRRCDAGLHWVVATAPGRAPAGRWVRIGAGDETRVKLELAPLPPERRAVDLRAGLGERIDEPAELRAGAGELATLVGVDHLILVRNRGRAREAALYEADRAALGPWGRLEATRLAPDPPDRDGPVATARSPRRDGDTPWYRAWWGRTAMVGGALAVGAVAYLVLAGGGGDEPVTIGGFCYEGQTCE